MKQNYFFVCVSIIACLFLLAGCPPKQAATPSSSMQAQSNELGSEPPVSFSRSMQTKIESLDSKLPAVFVLGNDGRIAASTMDGTTFEECVETQEQAEAAYKKSGKKMNVCRGLQEGAIQIGEEQIVTFKITTYKVNPYCKIVEDVTGTRQEVCKPFPW